MCDVDTSYLHDWQQQTQQVTVIHVSRQICIHMQHENEQEYFVLCDLVDLLYRFAKHIDLLYIPYNLHHDLER